MFSLYSIESATISKDGFQKVVRHQQLDPFKAVQVVAVKANSFKAVWEAMGPLLKPFAFACGFQNSPASFKMARPALKLSDSFEAGQVSNWFITYISEKCIQHNA